MASKSSVKIDDSSPITTSFPIFESLMAELGANFQKSEL
jgi:3-phosphoshikimate 1-carboxyvinyltransferase